MRFRRSAVVDQAWAHVPFGRPGCGTAGILQRSISVDSIAGMKEKRAERAYICIRGKTTRAGAHLSGWRHHGCCVQTAGVRVPFTDVFRRPSSFIPASRPRVDVGDAWLPSM